MYDVLGTVTNTDTRESTLIKLGSVSIAIAGVVVYDVLATSINPDTRHSIVVAGVVVYDVIRGRILGIPLEKNTGIQIVVAAVLADSVVVAIEDDPPPIVIADVTCHYVGIRLPHGYTLTSSSTIIINNSERARHPDKNTKVVVCTVIIDKDTIRNIIK